MSEIVQDIYQSFLNDIKETILSAQYEALKAVNKELIALYWDLGSMIVERQEEEGWGKSVVEMLSEDLQKEFSGIKGFSAANLWRMRNFYLTYRENEKLAPLVRENSWTKNIVIMEKCKDDFEREFYIKIQFYLAVLNDKAKLEDENPSIGIILCKEKNRIIVEYALKDTTQPIGVSTYRITSTLPAELQKYLPSGEEIAKRLEGVEL
jgi:predicted nuclease of restriction endonuclease-like (RecB) superfamily